MKKSQNIPKPFHWAKLACFDFSSSHFCRDCWDCECNKVQDLPKKSVINMIWLLLPVSERGPGVLLLVVSHLFLDVKKPEQNPQIYAILWVSEWVVIGSKGTAAAQLGKRKNFDLRDLWECTRQQDYRKGEKISPTTLPLMMPNGSSFVIWEGWLNCFSHLSIIANWIFLNAHLSKWLCASTAAFCLHNRLVSTVE